MKLAKLATGLLTGAALATGTGASAMTLTHEVLVQPIQVCYDSGVRCADMSAFSDGSLEGFADQIFGLAGLDVRFLSPTMVLSTVATGDIDEHLTRLPVEAGFSAVVFSRSIVPAVFDPQFGPVGIIGLGYVGGAGLVTGTNNTIENVALTFAHELGHNLGLDHWFQFGVGATNNLMDYGDCALGNCTLDGAQITQLQGDLSANTYKFVYAISAVPEPGALSLFLAGGLFGAWRLRVNGRQHRA